MNYNLFNLFANNITNAKQVEDLSTHLNPIEIQTNEVIKQTSILNETKGYSVKNLQQLELMYKSILNNQKTTTVLSGITIVIAFLTLITTILIAFLK